MKAGIRRWISVLATVGLGLLLTSEDRAAAQQRAPEIEILSKADAARLFGLTRVQWLQEVRRAATSGAARQTPGDSRLIGMSTTTAGGDLLTVRLDYSKGDEKPTFIQVVVGYRPPRAALFDDGALPDLVAAAQRQMAPEFEVQGSAERIQGGLGIFFMILDNRR